MKKQHIILQSNIKNPISMIILLIMLIFNALSFSFPGGNACITWDEAQKMPVDYSVNIDGPGDFYIRPNHNITYQYTITNTGNLNDTYNITVSKIQSWGNTSSIPLVLILSSGESEVFLVTVWVPSGTPIGATDQIDITITSNSNPLIYDSIQTGIVVIDGMLSPIANVGGPYNVKPNGSIVFVGTDSYDADGYIISYYWDFGDGTNGTGEVVTHCYANPGNYTISLKVVDDDGLFNSSQSTVIFNALPDSTEKNNKTPGFEIVIVLLSIAFIVLSKKLSNK